MPKQTGTAHRQSLMAFHTVTLCRPTSMQIIILMHHVALTLGLAVQHYTTQMLQSTPDSCFTSKVSSV